MAGRTSEGEEAREERARFPEPWLEYADRSLYGLAAILFLVAAWAMDSYSVVTFAKNLSDDFPLAVVRTWTSSSRLNWSSRRAGATSPGQSGNWPRTQESPT